VKRSRAILGRNPIRDSRMGMTVHDVREVSLGPPSHFMIMNPIPSHALKNPIQWFAKRITFKSLRRYIMSPEEEWVYEEKLDQLSLRLEELVIDAFIAVMQKLKERNESFIQASLKPFEDEMKF
jgi:hypothetical protein